LRPDSAVGYPTYGAVAQEWAASLRELLLKRSRFGGTVIGKRGVILFDNRNKITKEFLETGRRWLLMTDVDIVFAPGDVDALYDSAGRHGPGVYSGTVVSLGTRGIKPIFGDWSYSAQTCKFRPECPPADAPDQPTAIVPTAFLLVHRKVFEGIGDRGWFDHLRPTTGEDRVFGEDVSFCLRALNAGFPIHVVPGSRPGHVKAAVLYADPDRHRPAQEE
jgi:GT2 family glycosyltransferase